jgi:catechol 2,3-dioxygenase-like lactoylglutathione lyase family enzyme
MLDHVSIGVKDIARTKKFYDSVMKPLGYKCLSASEGSLGYGKDGVVFWANVADSPVLADMGSGLHFCFTAPDRKAVDAAGLKSGGKDNGKPGLRADYSPTYYASFVIDPDGYRIEAYYGSAV